MLGIPTEVYLYGIEYLYVLIGVALMAMLMQWVYLPVFHNLDITSTYEVRISTNHKDVVANEKTARVNGTLFQIVRVKGALLETGRVNKALFEISCVNWA